MRCSADLSGVDLTEESVFPASEGSRTELPDDVLVLAASDGRVIKVRDGEVVGRTAVGREVLDIHEEISRRHAQFVRTEGAWFVVDLNSSNGTFLEGERIRPGEKTLIRDGQQVMISPVFQARIKTGAGERRKEAAPLRQEEAGNVRDDRKTLVILFADLKGSVDFFQEKGTLVARNWIVNLYRMLSSVIDAHRGTHVKNIGDAILAVFDDPHDAVRAALNMQADLKAHNRATDEAEHYYMRIGMNIGTVIFEEHDVFGNAVNIASRVQDLAPPERIFISEHLYGEIRDDDTVRCRFVGHEQLKGVKERIGIYEITDDALSCSEKEEEGAP
jgi:class 3 adenylate cyclase